MKRYDQYKDSGIEWLGDIPTHWKIAKFKHMTELRGRIGWRGLTTDDYVDNGVILLGVRNISKLGKLNLEKISRIPLEKYDESPEIKVQKGDVLLAKTGATIGKTCVVDKLAEPMTVNAAVNIFRLKQNTVPKYFHFLLQSDFYQKEMWSNVSENAQGNLFQRDIKEIYGIMPPLKEQESIAEYLDEKTYAIEECINGKQKLIDLLNEEKAALINHAVTKGLDAAAPMRPSGVEWLGDFPAHWEVKKLKYVAEIYRGKFTHRPRNDEKLYNGEYPFIQTGDVAKAGKYVTEYCQTLNEVGYAVTTQFPAGTLLMTIAANIGDVAILNFNACFPDSIVGFYPFTMDREFLYYKLKSMKQVLLSTSVINTQMNLNVERVSQIQVSYPSIEEQLKIVGYIEEECQKINDTIKKISKEIDLLTEYKASLIYEVVTGKVKVDAPVEEPTAAAL